MVQKDGSRHDVPVRSHHSSSRVQLTLGNERVLYGVARTIAREDAQCLLSRQFLRESTVSGTSVGIEREADGRPVESPLTEYVELLAADVEVLRTVKRGRGLHSTFTHLRGGLAPSGFVAGRLASINDAPTSEGERRLPPQ